MNLTELAAQLGLPYAFAPQYQTQVPLIVWMPPALGELTSATLACLNTKRDAALSHDNLFHSVLGMVGVSAGEYRPQLDITASCRTAIARRNTNTTNMAAVQ